MSTTLIELLGIAPLANTLSSGLSYFGNRFFPGIKRGSKINDAITEADAEFAKKMRLAQLEQAKQSCLPLPGVLSSLSEERDSLHMDKLSVQITEDKIRQEARNDAQKELIEQLRVQLIIAFNDGNYDAALILTRILQNYLLTDSETYIDLENIRVSSLFELISSGANREKEHEYYRHLYEYVEEHFSTCDFHTLFKYGLSNLYMLPVVEETEIPLFLERAKKSFEKALTFQQDIDLTLNNLALALRYSERYAASREQRIEILENAIGYLEQAKRIAPQNHKVISNMADIYVRLAETFSEDYEEKYNFLHLAVQNYSDCLDLTRYFSLVIDKANALFYLGRIEQDSRTKGDLFKNSILFYNDAYIIAQSRDEAAFACLRIARVYNDWRSINDLSQDQKDIFIFHGLRYYVMALEHAPFYAKIQYETAKLILNIAKFGEQDIPSLKNLFLPNAQKTFLAVQKAQSSGHSTQSLVGKPRQLAEQAKLSIKAGVLEIFTRYFRDAVYLAPENPQVIAAYSEAGVYWAFLQKKMNNQERADKELETAAQALDKADELKPHSASYVRACLHAVKGETKLCENRLKEAVTNDVFPPRSQVAREPYFLEYSKTQWFKDILETIPERSESDLYSTTIFSDSGATV